MDLNTKIAERRAALQREQAAEIELRRSEERALESPRVSQRLIGLSQTTTAVF